MSPPDDPDDAPRLSLLLPLLALALALALPPLLYTLAAHVLAQRPPSIRGRRICLLIAHPDDEAMFFAPTVLGLTRRGAGNHVKILCLSAGDAAGLGATRKRELVKSGLALGLKGEEDVFVVDSPDFPDSMTATWDRDKICALLCSAFAPAPRRDAHTALAQARHGTPPAPSIDVLITFDARGVSAHPNHISLYHGARAFRHALPQVDLYTLGTVGVLRKYAGCVDALAALALALAGPGAWRAGSAAGRSGSGGAEGGTGEGVRKESDEDGRGSRKAQDDRPPGRLVFANKLAGEGPSLGTAWGAMTRAHRSQMVWFRYLWLGFSRYMLVNDLRLEGGDEA